MVTGHPQQEKRRYVHMNVGTVVCSFCAVVHYHDSVHAETCSVQFNLPELIYLVQQYALGSPNCHKDIVSV